ncbi:MAG: HAD-IA family hydrolase [Acidimicrobiia bacterium]|nr:HAD-IA family hydrolase [Acidimicrobiia bacterium]
MRSVIRVLGRAVLVVLILALTGCNADVVTTVQVEEDGSGTVEVAIVLDPELAAELPDLESAGLALADADDSGWVVEPREFVDEVRTRIRARKAFANPDQFTQVMNEIAGPDGLFGGFTLEKENSFAQVSYSVNGRIATNGFAGFSDSELDVLLGEPLETFVARINADPSQVNVRLSVTLPGEVRPDGSNGARLDQASDSTARFWSTTLDNPAEVPVQSEAITREIGPLVALGVAVLSGAIALLLALAVILRIVQNQQKPPTKPTNRPSARAPKKGPEIVLSDEPDEQNATASANPTVVALDGMGVLYGAAADIDDVLIPFCFEKGSTLTADEIAARARQLSLGRIEPSAFWQLVQVPGDPNKLDDEYLAKHALKPGVVKFLRSLRDREVRVACFTNDSATWARKLRQRHSLDTLVDPWVVSGTVGVRKPDRPIFEVLRRLTGQPPANILIVDDQLDILDAARALGYRTAWFAPDAAAEDARGHSILRSFDVPDQPSPEPAV